MSFKYFFGNCFIAILFFSVKCDAQIRYEQKVRGLLYGTIFGDAFGGPTEFQGEEWVQQTPHPPKVWKNGEVIDEKELTEARARIYLRSYHHLLANAEAYGVWSKNAKPGTITDDSRNKIVLMHLLREKSEKRNKSLGEKDVAKAYLTWLRPEVKMAHPLYDSLNREWLKEINFAAHWINGRRDSTARPPERMWNALPTCWGQMTNTPLATIYPGDANKSYLLAYNISFFDNAFARDMNAALVAGISHALTLDPAKMSNEEIWKRIISTIKNTDPYHYAEVPWCPRAVNKWLTLADSFATQAKGSPKVLFDRLNKEFEFNEKWEAHVVVGVCFSILKMCNYDPLASLQMSIEWGWDTDTYPQFLGAFLGAIYGEQLLKEEWKQTINQRLKSDYDEDINEWLQILVKMKKAGEKKILWKERK